MWPFVRIEADEQPRLRQRAVGSRILTWEMRRAALTISQGPTALEGVVFPFMETTGMPRIASSQLNSGQDKVDTRGDEGLRKGRSVCVNLSSLRPPASLL